MNILKEIEKDNIIREKLARGQVSPFKTYIELTIGETGIHRFLFYEFVTSLFGPMPGGIGIYLRKKMYPRLFKKVGKGLIIGRNVVIRHPDKIELGDNVTIDDNCIIDGRGAGNGGVVMEDNVLINRNCIVLARAGPIRLGKRTSIGSNSVIVSMDGVEIGEAVGIAAGCYISTGSYLFDDVNKAVIDHKAYTKGPVRIGDQAWLGTRVTVLDGVSIGRGALLGAGALVVKNVPENSIAFGVPARVIRQRDELSRLA